MLSGVCNERAGRMRSVFVIKDMSCNHLLVEQRDNGHFNISAFLPVHLTPDEATALAVALSTAAFPHITSARSSRASSARSTLAYARGGHYIGLDRGV